MARLTITNEALDLVGPNLDDAALERIVLTFAEEFATKGGCWLRLKVDDAHSVRWVPRTATVQADFDGGLPDAVWALAAAQAQPQ